MAMVHKMFRRDLGLMPRLLRGIAGPEHARIIAHHFDAVTPTLRHHHHGEVE